LVVCFGIIYLVPLKTLRFLVLTFYPISLEHPIRLEPHTKRSLLLPETFVVYSTPPPLKPLSTASMANSDGVAKGNDWLTTLLIELSNVGLFEKNGIITVLLKI